MRNPLRKPKQLQLERTYAAPIERVWEAWTDPALLRQWWGPEKTVVTLAVSITEIGPKAKMAAFGMKWGYKAQLDGLEELLS